MNAFYMPESIRGRRNAISPYNIMIWGETALFGPPARRVVGFGIDVGMNDTDNVGL